LKRIPQLSKVEWEEFALAYAALLSHFIINKTDSVMKKHVVGFEVLSAITVESTTFW
jgi:hypothetical protein